MFRPGLEKLPSYATGNEPVWRIKLDANERAAALPKPVRRRIDQRLRQVQEYRYPELKAEGLRQAIAALHGVKMEQVLVGNGSSELIGAVCSALGGPDRPIAYQWPSFSMYPIYAALADSPAVPVLLDEKFSLSVASVLETVQASGAKLLLLCNPNNPTGGVIPPADLREILTQAPCPVLVDEAYYEFYGESSLDWLAEFPRMMVLRTFSKAYGLAAARVGYLVASAELCAAIDKYSLPYHVNAFSLAAAQAALEMRPQILRQVRTTVRLRDTLIRQLGRLKQVECFPSATNFILIRVQQPSLLVKQFEQSGIGVRDFSRAAGLAGCLRITIGTRPEMEQVLECIREYERQLGEE